MRVRAWLSVAIASWFLVGGAARLTGCFFSPEHVRARPPARARPNLTPLGALPLIPTTPGSEILAPPSRYVRPSHPLLPPSVRPSGVTRKWREGQDLHGVVERRGEEKRGEESISSSSSKCAERASERAGPEPQTPEAPIVRRVIPSATATIMSLAPLSLFLCCLMMIYARGAFAVALCLRCSAVVWRRARRALTHLSYMYAPTPPPPRRRYVVSSPPPAAPEPRHGKEWHGGRGKRRRRVPPPSLLPLPSHLPTLHCDASRTVGETNLYDKKNYPKRFDSIFWSHQVWPSWKLPNQPSVRLLPH